MSERVDAYAHIGLPRFVRVEQLVQTLDRHGVGRAFVAAADTCPDIYEVSRAIVEHGDRFRAVGVPLGRSLDEIRSSLQVQAECGFLGIRIFDRMIADQPHLLGIMGNLNLVPWVVGGPGLEPAARLLLEFLEEDGDRQVVAPHFGGVASPIVLDHPGPVRDLFSHPRLLVIFSRHSAFEPQMVKEWAVALVEMLGWERILFGSEFPVCLWRNEKYATTMEWVGSLGVEINEDAFYGGNALRCLWRHPTHPPQLVDRSQYPAASNTAGTIQLFPHQGLELPEAVHRRLLERYWIEQDQYPDYRTFVAHILIECAARNEFYD